MERAANLLLALRDSGTDIYGAVSGFVQALIAAGVYLRLRQTPRALERGFLRVIGKEYIAERGARQTTDTCLLMYTEEVRISAL